MSIHEAIAAIAQIAASTNQKPPWCAANATSNTVDKKQVIVRNVHFTALPDCNYSFDSDTQHAIIADNAKINPPR